VVEASREHGPFDPRWPSARKGNARAVSTAPPLRAAEAAEALDWEAFSKRYFPGRKRHDLDALAAYATHTQGHEWGTPPARLSVVQNTFQAPSSWRVKRRECDAWWPRSPLIGRNRGGAHGYRES
jgi:hypothetical protein